MTTNTATAANDTLISQGLTALDASYTLADTLAAELDHLIQYTAREIVAGDFPLFITDDTLLSALYTEDGELIPQGLEAVAEVLNAHAEALREASEAAYHEAQAQAYADWLDAY